jgi:hypothetical protein
MTRLLTSTRGLCSWRDRLANPGIQWKRRRSAFETAVSWESVSRSRSGIPIALENLLRTHGFANPVLLLAVAEHQVELPGGRAASQSDVWAMVDTAAGIVSMTVEAKAGEAFGDEILSDWLVSGKSERSLENRKIRWHHVRAHLPDTDSFLQIRYQMLHRCAAAVIEAKRMGCPNAAFVVQAFDTPDRGKPDINFAEYVAFCTALRLPAARGTLSSTAVDGISLSVGWIDCPSATDAMIAACA